jgi:myosin heavy subunit
VTPTLSQLGSATTPSMMKDICLSSFAPTDYAILSNGNNDSIEPNGDQFAHIAKAIKELGLSDEVIATVWRVLGAILELGNLEFQDVDLPSGTASQIFESRQQHVVIAAQLLDLQVDKFVAVLVTREMKTNHETFTIPLQARESFQARNAFMKTLYSNLFAMIVNSINRTLSPESGIPTIVEESNTISVLDIFGFESFETNGFEQVCIPHTLSP